MPLTRVICALLYRQAPHARADEKAMPLGPSRGTVYKLAALFSIDALAGGFVAQSLLVLWLFHVFRPVAVAPPCFFLGEHAVGVLLSGGGLDLAAIGLVNTMVFTAYPSSDPLMISGRFARPTFTSRWRAPVALGAVADGCADPHFLCHWPW
jgi:hypothetical protein